ncbi:uncharacterized protein ACHE_10911A [Aspergillus chevalieri]|uniref:Cep57 centrosome microtubule-binding domain-containing protein n=1 Tax=Aspergillus chevalieri TaxID=182096 RepID=A0A7R7ZJG4_ASPCH|nr:uncharacterized protein ACHE_10911A [Aspergillus chevalieri]BCR83509.1 hypothetical protein ACHE_10911A [Aspergillus chevalieri]
MDNTTGSFASFGSDFDPEHEALQSTNHGNNSPRLPNMTSNARKNHNNHHSYDGADDEEPDYAINTSAIERAFPEFSNAGSSSDDDLHDDLLDDELSVELGRGVSSNPTRHMEDSRNSLMSFENSVRSSSPAVRLDYPTSHTPQKSAMRAQPRRAVSENLRKDAQVRRASQAQKENIKPQSNAPKRTLSEMHARARDPYDISFTGDEQRPSPGRGNSRSTRFGNANLSHQIAEAVERASREVRPGGKLSNSTRSVAGNGAGDTFTHQSFLLPDLPNLSELVSGVYEDGTPVLPSHKKMRSTRFVSPSQDPDTSVSRQHLPLDAVPVPDDEKALFVSLRVLQERVAELEHAKSDAEKKIQDMRQENAFLKSDRSRPKDKYSRRDYDSEEEYRRDSRLASENQKLEATNLALQNRLDIIDRKAQISESTLNKLTHERDMAVSQLGVAYLEAQEFKNQNEKLRRENAELKSQLARSTNYTQGTRDDTGRTEQSVATDEIDDDTQTNTQRSADVSRNTRDLTTRSTRSRLKPTRDEDTRSKISTQVDKEISRLEKERAEEALFSLDVPRTRKQKSESRSADRSDKKKPNTGKRVKRVVVEEVDVTDPVETTTEEVTRHTRKLSQGEQDLTLLSFIDEREIAQLRKTLEEERLARKQRLGLPKEPTATHETSNTTRQSSRAPVPRKSSLKDTSKAPPRPTSAIGDVTATPKASAPEDGNLTVPKERQRRHSDNGPNFVSPRRRRRDMEEMTSAFILPDITIRHADLAAQDPSKLPEATQRALDGIAQHNGKNCTVCQRIIPAGSSCDHTHEVQVPKPIPVSERMPEPTVYNEEPTLRPAQDPPIALATVLKALEDELSHLKMQLATYQAAYNKLDASLGKRQRKTLGERIEKLLKDVDMKADQIYALYDVLEGQKQDGREMTEREMEQTLQSIGIDNSGERGDVTASTHKSASARKNTEPAVEDEDDDDELPWEGIESTMDVTGRSGR